MTLSEHTCVTCGLAKPIHDFPKSSQSKIGVKNKCKPCGRSYWLAYAKANPEKVKARDRARNVAPDKTAYWSTEDRRRKQNARRASKPDLYRAARLRHYAKHSESYCRRAREYRARKMNAPTIEAFDRLDIYFRDKGMCHICKKLVSRYLFTIDHLISLAAGGPHTASNVMVAHRSCNSRRGVVYE